MCLRNWNNNVLVWFSVYSMSQTPKPHANVLSSSNWWEFMIFWYFGRVYSSQGECEKTVLITKSRGFIKSVENLIFITGHPFQYATFYLFFW